MQFCDVMLAEVGTTVCTHAIPAPQATTIGIKSLSIITQDGATGHLQFPARFERWHNMMFLHCAHNAKKMMFLGLIAQAATEDHSGRAVTCSRAFSFCPSEGREQLRRVLSSTITIFPRSSNLSSSTMPFTQTSCSTCRHEIHSLNSSSCHAADQIVHHASIDD